MSKIISTANPWHIAVCRPEPHGSQLTTALNKAGFKAITQSFFSTKSTTNAAKIKAALVNSQPEIIIFISSAAVKFSQQALAINTWQTLVVSPITFIAVGKKTASILHDYQLNSVIVPRQENSEGLLALPILKQVQDKNILIIRGDNGRELLANTLRDRSAKVTYFASYKKVWQKLNKDNLTQQWQKNNINCIVITSVALLDKLVELLALTRSKNYWFNHCHWLVASQRIAKQAKKYNINKVINANGASVQAIINKISMMDLHND